VPARFAARLIGYCFSDTVRFRENCFRVVFICGDVMPPWAGDKLFALFYPKREVRNRTNWSDGIRGAVTAGISSEIGSIENEL
jgi:hypothetical protein